MLYLGLKIQNNEKFVGSVFFCESTLVLKFKIRAKIHSISLFGDSVDADKNHGMFWNVLDYI